jgi:pimeloyl-ACP methyl ester carboxylesterase
MPKMKVNGLTFHVQQAGEGPDVILIHGVTGDLSIWFLCKAMTELAKTHRVTAFDLRGHGYSDVPPAGYTSADHAGDVLALMDEIGASHAKLVGHSFGAVVALHTAAFAPERVDALVLSDPYFPALRHLEDLSRWSHWQVFHQEAADAGVNLSSEHWYDLGKFFDQVMHLDGDKLLQFRRAVGLPGLNRLLRLGGTTAGDDSKVEAGLTAEKILAIHQPTLAIYGEYSPFLSTANYLVEHLPNCRSVLVPGAQHRAPEENPEAFTSALKAWIESLEAPSLVEAGEASR